MNANEQARVYDTLLSVPGMNETVKIDLRISRKLVLLLSQVIERGLDVNIDGGIPLQKSQEDLKALSADCLEKAGLTELSIKLKALHKQ